MQEAQSLVIHPSPKNRYMEKVLFFQQLRFDYKTGVGNVHTFHLNQTAIPCTNLCKAERLEIGTLRASLAPQLHVPNHSCSHQFIIDCKLSIKPSLIVYIFQQLTINSFFLNKKPMDVTMASAVNTTIRKSAGYTTPGSNITMSGVDSQPFSPQRGSSFPSPTQIDPFYTQG